MNEYYSNVVFWYSNTSPYMLVQIGALIGIKDKLTSNTEYGLTNAAIDTAVECKLHEVMLLKGGHLPRLNAQKATGTGLGTELCSEAILLLSVCTSHRVPQFFRTFFLASQSQFRSE